MTTWLLVDGHNMAFRCFYAVPMMTTSHGVPVNAIHGWVRSLWKLEELVHPDAVCVFFDAGGSVDRKDVLSTYKANRKPMPDELKQQLEYMNLMSIAHGYYIVSHEGIEADDLLGTFAKRVDQCGSRAYIASGDKDFAQCVGNNVYQMLPPAADAKGNWRMLDTDGVLEKFGVMPSQIVDYLSLLGDAADNIPGVKGVGEKTSRCLLNEFGSIDKIFENLENIFSKKVRENIANSRELLDRNRRLISLHHVDNFCLPEAKIRRSVDDIFNLLKELELNALLKVATKKFSSQVELF